MIVHDHANHSRHDELPQIEEMMTKLQRCFPACPECHLGNLNPKRVSYFTMQDGHVICVPDFAAMVCDACGWREYDADALLELHAMLATDRRSRRQPKARRPEGESTQPHKPASHRRPT
jgi:YgiT-type zinc finger domain-containing protein